MPPVRAVIQTRKPPLPFRRLAPIGASLALALLLGACAPGAAAPGGPAGDTGSAHAELLDEHIPEVRGDWTSQLPATVISHDLGGEREVTVQRADRVIALDIAGSIATTLVGLGESDRLVGRDISTDFPGSEELPLVMSGGHSVSAESVLALRPDLIISDGTVGPVDVIEQLRDAGITVVFVDHDASFAGAAQLAIQVGEAIGMPEAGAELAAEITAGITAQVTAAQALAPTPPLRMLFLYLRGSSGIYYVFGEGTGSDALIDALGGIDAAGELGIVGTRPASDEAIVAAKPDLVLLMSNGLASVGGVDGMLETLPALALTPAGANRRFVDMDDAIILGFGPRTPAVIAALANAAYGQ